MKAKFRRYLRRQRLATVPKLQAQAPLAKSDLDAVNRLYTVSRAENTRRGYQKDWGRFEAWCRGKGRVPLPAAPETVAAYIAYLVEEKRKAATIDRALTSISVMHKLCKFPSPRSSESVREARRGARRELGTAQKQVAALRPDALRAMLLNVPEGLVGIRDRAILCLGFAGALRRSEIAALHVEHVTRDEKGLSIFIVKSKTDPEGRGAKVPIYFGDHPETCPVRAVGAWLTAAQIETGFLFRRLHKSGKITRSGLNGAVVWVLIKKYAKLAGLDAKMFGAHSLRSGLITTAIRAGKSEVSVMKQSRHESVKVFRSYVRDADLFDNDTSKGIGL